MDPRSLAALRRGDPQALDAFCAENAERVLRWAIALGGPRLDAEDVAQDVLEVALKRLHTYRGDASPSTWLYGIARNVIRNARRKHAILKAIGWETVPEPPSDLPLADEALELHRRRRAVQHALEHLRDIHREAIVLVDLEGRSCAEVGELLGVPTGTVYSRLHHARRALAAALAAEGVHVDEASHLVVVSDRSSA